MTKKSLLNKTENHVQISAAVIIPLITLSSNCIVVHIIQKGLNIP